MHEVLRLFQEFVQIRLVPREVKPPAKLGSKLIGVLAPHEGRLADLEGICILEAGPHCQRAALEVLHLAGGHPGDLVPEQQALALLHELPAVPPHGLVRWFLAPVHGDLDRLCADLLEPIRERLEGLLLEFLLLDELRLRPVGLFLFACFNQVLRRLRQRVWRALLLGALQLIEVCLEGSLPLVSNELHRLQCLLQLLCILRLRDRTQVLVFLVDGGRIFDAVEREVVLYLEHDGEVGEPTCLDEQVLK
mmetsp:Transcript_56647/g.184297  ORF Transcript_56647/g.184297 Transcript_56647/m.184297 type:complete len:249 (+) Transcript_56647:1627-2373(+)